MRSLKKTFLVGVLTGFVGLQFFVSLSRGNFYPFSPYRMFSKYWPNGVQMEKVRFLDEKSTVSFSPAQLLRVPFFQANNIAFVSFLDSSSLAQKEAVCGLLLKSAQSSSLKVLAELEEFRRSEVGLVVKTVESREVYVCRAP